jgi:hypothetical protein
MLPAAPSSLRATDQGWSVRSVWCRSWPTAAQTGSLPCRPRRGGYEPPRERHQHERARDHIDRQPRPRGLRAWAPRPPGDQADGRPEHERDQLLETHALLRPRACRPPTSPHGQPLFGDRSVASRVSGGRARARRDRRARVLAACALRVSRYRCAFRAETSSRLSRIYVSRRLTNTCWANFVSLIEGQLVAPHDGLDWSHHIERNSPPRYSAIRDPTCRKRRREVAVAGGRRTRCFCQGHLRRLLTPPPRSK